MSTSSINERRDYHHIIPKCLFGYFNDEHHRELNQFQILVDRTIHDLIETTNKPLVYLIENGFPKTEEEFQIFISYISKSMANHTEDFIDYEFVEIECTCGYKTPINPRSHKVKYCRNCGEPIYNSHNNSEEKANEYAQGSRR